MTVDVKIDATGSKRAAGRIFEIGVGWTTLLTSSGHPAVNFSQDHLIADMPSAVRRILDEPEDTLAMAQSRERYWSRRCADAEAERDAAAALARGYRDQLDARGVRWFWQR